MPRPRRVGRIFFNPDITYFKPAGVMLRELEETILTKEELEAIRVIDLEQTEQKNAAEKMKISQPTLSRLLTSARKKIADSLVNGKAIRIHGGIYKMASQGRQGRMGGFAAGPIGFCICPKCNHKTEHQRGTPCSEITCPKCGTKMTRGE